MSPRPKIDEHLQLEQLRRRHNELRQRHMESVARKSAVAPKKPASFFSYKLKAPGLIRLFTSVLVFAAQFALLIYLALRMNRGSIYVIWGLELIGLALAIYLVQKQKNSSYTLAWTVLLLAVPPLGLLLYGLWGRDGRFPRKVARIRAARERLKPYFPNPDTILERLPESTLDSGAGLQLSLLAKQGFPLYTGSQGRYFPSGEEQFQCMYEDLKAAEHYIFLEYFILADGLLWNQTEKLLISKAEQGVEVRLFFDDFGSIAKAPTHLIRRLSKHGVRVLSFNPVSRYISRLYVNYRLHQKVCVVDGRVAWVGGANLADEYANIYERFGYWKDTALRFEGRVAEGCAMGFLLLWEMETGSGESDYLRYFPSYRSSSSAEETFPAHNGDSVSFPVHVPFWDGPLLSENDAAKSLYLSIITTSTRRLYITSPYVILDEQTQQDLCRASLSGVDVRLLVPGIPDKKNIYLLTKAGFGPLLKSGIRVYTYSPGFIHAKSVCADGCRAVLGSINLDYRSFYLNYENAVYVCDQDLVNAMEQDYLATLTDAHEVSWDEWNHRPLWDKILEVFLKLFSPLL